MTFTAAATNPYTITASPGLMLTINSVGIANNSGTIQNLIAAAGKNGAIGESAFTNSASEGNANILSEGGSVQFSNRSTASTITNEDYGTTNFFDRFTSGGCLSCQNDSKFLISERS